MSISTSASSSSHCGSSATQRPPTSCDDDIDPVTSRREGKGNIVAITTVRQGETECSHVWQPSRTKAVTIKRTRYITSRLLFVFWWKHTSHFFHPLSPLSLIFHIVQFCSDGECSSFAWSTDCCLTVFLRRVSGLPVLADLNTMCYRGPQSTNPAAKKTLMKIYRCGGKGVIKVHKTQHIKNPYLANGNDASIT